MAHVQPLLREESPELEEIFAATELSMGYVPNTYLTMARRPEMLKAFAPLLRTIIATKTIDSSLVSMVSLVASQAAGCRYCQAHRSIVGVRRGVDARKMDEVWTFESSDLFTDGERAALRLAMDGAQVPNAVTEEHFLALRDHYSDDQIIDIVAVISLFGFLNRWNDTLATELEAEPSEFAASKLTSKGWTAGKHATGTSVGPGQS